VNRLTVWEVMTEMVAVNDGSLRMTNHGWDVGNPEISAQDTGNPGRNVNHLVVTAFFERV
jgi:hypothetical protein